MYMCGVTGYRGMRGRRGLGQTTPDVTSTITYLGVVPDQTSTDLTGQNQIIAAPLSPFSLAALSAANAAYFQPPATGTTATTFTQWINKNAATAIIGAVVFLIAWKTVSR